MIYIDFEHKTINPNSSLYKGNYFIFTLLNYFFREYDLFLSFYYLKRVCISSKTSIRVLFVINKRLSESS